MSTQFKSFEGPDVQVLLDRIRAEIGPGAKIDGAEKIRVGGLLGFFAKEHYRVRVEIPDPPARPTQAVVDGAPKRLSRRARRRQVAEVASTEATGSPVAGVPEHRAPEALQPEVPPPATVERTEAITHAVPAQATDVFSVMADATDDVIDVSSLPPTTAALAPPVIESPVVAEPFVPAEAVVAEPVTAEHPSMVDEPLAGSFDAVLTRVASSLEAPTNGHGPAPDNYAAHRPGYSVEPEMSSEDHLSVTSPDIASKAAQFLAESSPALPASMASTESAAWGEGGLRPDRTSPHDAVVEALRGAGLGEGLVQVVSEARHHCSLEAALVRAFSTLPVAPVLPRSPGSLLVVVGPGSPARRLAAALAGEMGVDPAGIPLASLDAGAYSFVTGPLLVRSADEGAERAPGWRRSNPAVVVVDACVTGPHRSWASHVIAGLRPTAVWGVVDATSKTEDIGAWAGALGGIDALALENLDATVSPASALSVGLPVARLDGQPATATRWAAALIDRMGPSSNGTESDGR